RFCSWIASTSTTSSRPPRDEAFCKPRREVAVNARHLQGASMDGRAEFIQGAVAQLPKVPPQDQIDEPQALDHAHPLRVHVGPPVVLPKVVWHRTGLLARKGLEPRGGFRSPRPTS